MHSKYFTKLKQLLVLVISSVFSFSASAENLKTHLIETNPGQVFWASEEEMNSLSKRAHADGRCGGFLDITHHSAPLDLLERGTSHSIDYDRLRPSWMTTLAPLLAQAGAGNLIATITQLAAYQNRYYTEDTGKIAAEWLRDQYLKLGQGRSDVHVDLFKHSDFQQPSVIATLDGSGPDKDEIIVVGSHIDSINHEDDSSIEKARAPGADDNASGTATVLETFRILVQSGFRPNRTIQFMGFAAEEVGLLGSQDIAEKYSHERKNVVGVIQMDMTMFPESDQKIALISDYTNASLNRFLGRLIDLYVKAPWNFDECGYPCSDHASWTHQGFPASFPFEARMDSHNPYIHSARDTIDRLTPSFGVEFLKLTLAFSVEAAQAGIRN